MSAAELIFRAAHRAIRPKMTLTVSEWADANRMLSGLGSAEAGPWRTSRTPYLREIMDQLSEDSPVREIYVMKGSQLGFTEAGSNWIGYVIDHAKGPAAVIMPTERSLTDWMSQKFEPMATDTPRVRDALAGKTSGDNNAQRKRFVGGILYAKTAGSTADLKSTSLRYVLGDELDEWDWATSQGDPLGLVIVRQTTFHDRKLFAPSSPTTKDVSRIEERFNGGDQRRYHVPCPYCRELQHLKWGNLGYRRDPTSRFGVIEAWYACEHCGSEIREDQKTEMMKEAGYGGRARWVPGNPGAPYPSYHINALYAPVGLGLSWVEIVMEWLEAQDDPAKLMRFVNTRLGEPWADRSRDIKANALMARAEPYDLRTLPPGCLVITTGVDVQGDRLEVQVLGHGKGERTWTLDYHVLPGNPAGDEIWAALADYVNGIAFANAQGKILHSEACGIDTGGHHTHAVYTFVRSGAVLRAMALKGASTPGRAILGKPSMQDVNWRGRTLKKGVALYLVGSDVAKHLLYARLEGDAAKPPADRKVRFSHQLDERFYDGLVAETFNPRRNRWEMKKGKRNEPLDTWYLALAASHHPELYLHKWKASDWARRAAMMGETADSAPTQSPPAAPQPTPASRTQRPPTAPKPADQDGGFGSSDWQL